MTRLLLIQLVPVGLSMVLLLGSPGCATTSDLEKLSAGTSQKLEAMNSTLTAQVENLGAALQTTQAAHTKQHDELKTMLEVVKSEMATANMLTGYSAETMRGIKDIAAWTDDVNKQLDSLRQLRVAVDKLPSLLSGLGTEVHSLRQTLLNTYKLEESALRDRLRALEQLRRQLEALPVGNHTGKSAAQGG